MFLSGNFVAVKKSKASRKTQLVVNTKTGAIYNKSKKTLSLKKVDKVKINTVALAVLNNKIKENKLDRNKLETLLTLQTSEKIEVTTLKTSRKIDTKSVVALLNKK